MAAATTPEPTVRFTGYIVSCLPEDDEEGHLFEITVEYRGGGLWAVTRHDDCLGADGEWARGIKPYGRGGGWLASHRFDLETALRLAKEAAPHVVVNGVTAAEAAARTR